MSIDRNENIFYVYAYLDPRKSGSYEYGEFKFNFEPFYIGKGYGSRLYKHLNKCNLNDSKNRMKSNKIKKLFRLGYDIKNNFIVKVSQNLNDEQSLELEKLLIKSIGRQDLGLGPLTNLTNGGDDGVMGYKFSEQSRQKMRIAKLGTKHSAEQKLQRSKMFSGSGNPSYGKKASAETIKRLRDSHTGLTQTIDTILKRTSKLRKLNDEQVLEILKKHKTGKYTQQQLADEYKTGRTSVGGIVNNRLQYLRFMDK